MEGTLFLILCAPAVIVFLLLLAGLLTVSHRAAAAEEAMIAREGKGQNETL